MQYPFSSNVEGISLIFALRTEARHRKIKSFAIFRISNLCAPFSMELKFIPSDLCLCKTFSFKMSCSYISLKPQVGIRSKKLVRTTVDPYHTSKFICAGISFSRRFQPLNAKVSRVCFDNYLVKASGASNEVVTGDKSFEFLNPNALGDWLKRRLGIIVLVYCIIRCNNAFAIEGVVSSGEKGMGAVSLLLKNACPKFLQVMNVFKEQGLVLAALLGFSAFFSMAETSIMTLWPWKVRELAEKEAENGVFKMLRNDVTRVLTTILIGTTVVNIGATALVTEAATTIFGEAGVSAATGIMTVAILLLTEITPKSIAVHHAADVARFVVRPVAWLSVVLYPVGRVVTFLSVGILKLLGLKGRSEPNVTEEELKLMLRVAELSGAIEEEEQDMIEKVLEIKDTHVREVMTPLVDVMAIDACSTYVDFRNSWVMHQYSRVPVFEERIDNIVGIAYACNGSSGFCSKGRYTRDFDG